MRRKILRWALSLVLLLSPQSVPSQVATKPSLDSLLERVNAYWNLLAAGKKLEAMEFVGQEGRETFISTQSPKFSEPRVSGLELAPNGMEVFVTVTVKRLLPPITTPMDWPVTEKWMFHLGNWFVAMAKPSFPFATGPATGKTPPLMPEEVERRKKVIRNALQFQTAVLDFGTVRQGKTAHLSLKYRLDGYQAMDVGFRNIPPDLFILGLAGSKLPAGRSQAVEMQLVTQNYEGSVKEGFALVVRHQEVEVPFEFTLQGSVYTPVSVLPRVLRFLRAEREKEIVVRNNTRSEVRVESVASESGGFKVEPLPQALVPGKETRLKIIHHVSNSQPNYQEVLALVFSTPVEGMAELSLPIVLNYVEQKRKTVPELTPAEIQKLIRESKPQ